MAEERKGEVQKAVGVFGVLLPEGKRDEEGRLRKGAVVSESDVGGRDNFDALTAGGYLRRHAAAKEG